MALSDFCQVIRHSVNAERANSREGGGLRSISPVLFRWDISHSLNMTRFYPLSSALPTLRLRGGRAPFVAIATFPPFQRGNLPRRRKRKNCVFASKAKQSPGRVEVYGVYSPYFFGGIFRIRSI